MYYQLPTYLFIYLSNSLFTLKEHFWNALTGSACRESRPFWVRFIIVHSESPNSSHFCISAVHYTLSHPITSCPSQFYPPSLLMSIGWLLSVQFSFPPLCCVSRSSRPTWFTYENNYEVPHYVIFSYLQGCVICSKIYEFVLRTCCSGYIRHQNEVCAVSIRFWNRMTQGRVQRKVWVADYWRSVECHVVCPVLCVATYRLLFIQES
jgi:hypothetical protein